MVYDNIKNINKRLLINLLNKDESRIKYPAKLTVVKQVAHELKYGKFNNYESDIVFEIKNTQSNYIKSTKDILLILTQEICNKNRFAIQISEDDVFIIIQDWMQVNTESLNNINTPLFN